MELIAHADFIAGLAKGLAVLESFDTERQRLNATLVAARTGITRAAARRHLLTLRHLGYLESDGQYFWMTPKVLRFSGSYLASARLPRTVQPSLNRLAAQTRLPFSVSILDEHEVVTVARSANADQQERRVAHGLHLGSRLPAHATSAGRILLAALSDAQLELWLRTHPLTRFTAHTVCSTPQLLSILYSVRQQDYCIARDEHELHVQAIAVPIRDRQGNIQAALNVVGTAQMMKSESATQELLKMLQESARDLRPML